MLIKWTQFIMQPRSLHGSDKVQFFTTPSLISSPSSTLVTAYCLLDHYTRYWTASGQEQYRFLWDSIRNALHLSYHSEACSLPLSTLQADHPQTLPQDFYSPGCVFGPQIGSLAFLVKGQLTTSPEKPWEKERETSSHISDVERFKEGGKDRNVIVEPQNYCAKILYGNVKVSVSFLNKWSHCHKWQMDH